MLLGRHHGGAPADSGHLAAEAFIAAKSRRAFCNRLGLSLERMVEAELCRNQLLRGARLRVQGLFVEVCGRWAFRRTRIATRETFAWPPGPETALRVWPEVRAAVVAGLYPQVVKVDRPPPKYAVTGPRSQRNVGSGKLGGGDTDRERRPWRPLLPPSAARLSPPLLAAL